MSNTETMTPIEVVARAISPEVWSENPTQAFIAKGPTGAPLDRIKSIWWARNQPHRKHSLEKAKAALKALEGNITPEMVDAAFTSHWAQGAGKAKVAMKAALKAALTAAKG